MTCDIAGLFYLKFDWRGCGDVSTVSFVFGETDHILIVMRDLYFADGLSVLEPIEFLPLSFHLSEAKHYIITSSSKNVFSFFGNGNVCAEFFMLPKLPVFIRLVSLYELIFKLLQVDIVFFLCFWSRLFFFMLWSFGGLLSLQFLLFLVLLHFFCFRINFHSFNNIIIDNPNIIFI